MGNPDGDQTSKLRGGSLVVVWVLAVLLVAACGDPRGQVASSSSSSLSSSVTTSPVAASAPSSLSLSTSTAVTTSSPQAEPDDDEMAEDYEGGGAVGANAPEVDVEPGETVLIPLTFEDAPRASVMLLLDSVEGVTARFGDTPLEKSEFFTSEMLSIDLVDPIDGDLEVVNDGPGRVTGGVLIILDSPRRLSVSADPSQIPLGGTVELEVLLTDSSPHDQVVLAITGQGDSEFTLPAMELDAAGSATTTFTPEDPGFYTVVALVEGERPRIANTLFEVQLDQPGTSTGGGDP